MKEEPIFRGITAALLATALSISAYHRHRAEQASEEKISWEDEGLPTIIALRSSGLALWLSVVAYLLKPRWMKRFTLSLPTWLRWSGAGLGAATLPLSYWVFRSLGKNVTPTVETRENHELVTSGPYRWARHPLYSVGTAFFVSLSLVAANWLIGLASLSALSMLLVRLPKEEAKLIERFGDEYREYIRRTGRFFPRLKGSS